MRHLWLACAALLAACFTDSGAVLSAGATTDAPATTDATTTSSTTASTSTTTLATTDAATSTSTTAPVGSTTDASTASQTSGGTTTGDTTGAGTTGSIDIPVPGCDPLYFNDFSQDDGGLVYEGGDWSWNQGAGELVLVANGGSVNAWVPDVAWKDFVVHARLRIDAGGGYASLRARGQPNVGEFYYAGVSAGSQQLLMGTTANGQSNSKGSAQLTIEQGTWYVLRFDLFGEQLAAQLDGIGAKFSDAQFPEGSAAIGGYGSATISFDWFLVCKA